MGTCRYRAQPESQAAATIMTCFSPQQRLAIYGTLAPGEINFHQIKDLKGRWLTGIVRGYLSPIGWGATHGFPGLKLAPQGDKISVQVLESADLPAHWARLDAFEGEEYRRTVATVETLNGPIEASIYVVHL